MADLTIMLTIPQLNVKREPIEVPDDGQVDALCAALGEEFNIPTVDSQGSPISYKLENETQKFIYKDSDTLASRGTNAEDSCVLTYEYEPGLQ